MEGLRFRVQGFKHTGYVAVLYNPGSDYFEVELQDDMGRAKTRVEDVCFTELVDKIDELVERTDNYEGMPAPSYSNCSYNLSYLPD